MGYLQADPWRQAQVVKCFMPNQYTNDPRQVPCVCLNCGAKYSTFRALLKGKRTFCSKACHYSFGQVICRCERCRRTFTIPKSHAAKGGRFCGMACKITPEGIKRRQSTAATQRRRAIKKKAAGTTTEAQLGARIAMWGGRCYMCGVAATTIDHVIPLSKGGTNWPANLRPACKPCNSAKGTKITHKRAAP